MCHLLTPLTKWGVHPYNLVISQYLPPKKTFAPDIQKVQIVSWHQVPPGSNDGWHATIGRVGKSQQKYPGGEFP